MKPEHSVRIFLALTGNYDNGRTSTVTGHDMYGNPVTETIPGLDLDRLDADAEKMLRKMARRLS